MELRAVRRDGRLLRTEHQVILGRVRIVLKYETEVGGRIVDPSLHDGQARRVEYDVADASRSRGNRPQYGRAAVERTLRAGGLPIGPSGGLVPSGLQFRPIALQLVDLIRVSARAGHVERQRRRLQRAAGGNAGQVPLEECPIVGIAIDDQARRCAIVGCLASAVDIGIGRGRQRGSRRVHHDVDIVRGRELRIGRFELQPVFPLVLKVAVVSMAEASAERNACPDHCIRSKWLSPGSAIHRR